ncbi:MAG: hypothetical protein V3V10_02945, partial [Planctomycetota bacterium]
MRTVIVERAAKMDIAIASDYYESKAYGLGSEFINTILDNFDLICTHPSVSDRLRVSYELK